MVKNYTSLSKNLQLLGHPKNSIIDNDITCWSMFPKHHNIYNKLWLSEIQGVPCGPMGVQPGAYPVIMKPIINLFGMSRGFKVIYNSEEYNSIVKDSFFWMPLLIGDHYCIDLVIQNGQIVFYTALQSFSYNDGSFNYHRFIPTFNLDKSVKKLVEDVLSGYTGLANIEIISNIIIDFHLQTKWRLLLIW